MSNTKQNIIEHMGHLVWLIPALLLFIVGMQGLVYA